MKYLLFFVLLPFFLYGMERDDFELSLSESKKRLEKSSEPKRLVEVHNEIKQTLSSTNEHFVYLNEQLKLTNDNIVAVNALLEKVQKTEQNIMSVHSDIKLGVGLTVTCLCCCLIIPMWIVLGYIVANNP